MAARRGRGRGRDAGAAGRGAAVSDLRATLRERFEIGAHPLAFAGSSEERAGGVTLRRVRFTTRAGAPVGLGVDGAASNEAGELGGELRQALLLARLAGGPQALTARESLELGTIHGARCLGRDAEIGSLEPGKLADIALWRLDDVDRAGIADPVAALALGPRPLVDTLLVGGRVVVERGELRTADEESVARELGEQSRRLASRAGVAA